MFPTGEPLTLAPTHPITLTVGHCLVNHCFPSAPFILNQDFGTRREALGRTANERAATQAAVCRGRGHTDTLELMLAHPWVYFTGVWTQDSVRLFLISVKSAQSVPDHDVISRRCLCASRLFFFTG